METKVTPAAIKGLILGLVLVAFGLVTVYTNQMENQALGFIPMVICIAGIIWACINYSNQMNNNVTFGNVFVHGFKVVAAITAIMALYTILLFMVIKPELVEISLQKAREGMEKKGTSEGDIENSLRIVRKMFIPFAVIGVVLIYGIGGTIVALIGGAVAKKNPQPTNPF